MNRQCVAAFAVVLTSSVTAFAVLPDPYLQYRMDEIVEGKALNSGTNADPRCDLTLGGSVHVVDIADRKGLAFDFNREAWAKGWTPGVRGRTVSFWLWRPTEPGESGFDPSHQPGRIFDLARMSKLSIMGHLPLPGQEDSFDVKLGDGESTQWDVDHTYFYRAVTPSRGVWHHLAFVFEDTGMTNPDDVTVRSTTSASTWTVG